MVDVAIVSYLIGSFPTAYLVTKALTGKDIRDHGSGNVGGLNTYRVVSREKGKLFGLFAGAVVVPVDASKALLSYLIAHFYSPSSAWLAPFFAILGHNYPVWLGFRGGRGLAALLGFFLYTSPILFTLFLLTQGAVYMFTRRFAPGAILALLLALPLHSLIFGPVRISHVLAEFPVWLRYREKYLLWRRGKLGVNM